MVDKFKIIKVLFWNVKYKRIFIWSFWVFCIMLNFDVCLLKWICLKVVNMFDSLLVILVNKLLNLVNSICLDVIGLLLFLFNYI